MTEVWVCIVAVAAVSMALKAVGPAVLGDRELPAWATRIIALLASALLAGLVVVGVLRAHGDDVSWPLLAGLAVVGVARWRGVPDLPAIVCGVVVTALLRLATG